jgi:hypothetical protein
MIKDVVVNIPKRERLRVARDSPGLLVWLILGRMMQLDAFWVNVGV